MNINHKGWPRPVEERNGHNTPMPWVGGSGPEKGGWSITDGNRAWAASDAKICVVCGNELSADWVYMVANLEVTLGTHSFGKEPLVADKKGENGLPSPTRVHPKCGVIAAKFCPHLKKNRLPAKTQSGLFLTHQELMNLARNSPKPVNDGKPDIPYVEDEKPEKQFELIFRSYSAGF